MVHIERSQVGVPNILTVIKLGRKKTGDQEKKEAIAHYTADPPKEGSFTFKIYRDPEVKDALRELFHQKCAYCESVIGPSQPGDIEHFRPKSIYYWLAADWNNLLLACAMCNRPNKVHVPGQSKKATRGKGDQFPLPANANRLQPHSTVVDDEPRLLLEPCLDHPNNHLDFLGEGGQVFPGLIDNNGDPDPNGATSEMGEASIEVYALDRRQLAIARYEKLHRLIFQIKRLFIAVDKYWEDKTDANKNEVAREMFDTKRLCEPQEEYAGMCQQYLDRFLVALFERKENFDEAVESIPGAKKVIMDAEVRFLAARPEINRRLADLGL